MEYNFFSMLYSIGNYPIEVENRKKIKKINLRVKMKKLKSPTLNQRELGSIGLVTLLSSVFLLENSTLLKSDTPEILWNKIKLKHK